MAKELAFVSYSEKLKDPRWQKKRLKVLERDNWTCQSCFDFKDTLHIHHMVYDYRKEPWEYEDHLLVTLCAECHGLAKGMTEQNAIMFNETLDIRIKHHGK